MAEINLVAETGRITGTRSSKRLRHEGRIPGIVYGHGMQPVAVAVERRALRLALSTPAGTNAVIDLQVDGDTHPTVVKQLQRDPVRRTVTHIDFQVVNLNEEITVDVPVVLEGEASDVLSQDGVVDQALTTLSVTTTPRNIPDAITYDVSGLQVGDVVRVGDLSLPANVVTSVDPETPVVTGSFVQTDLPEEAPAAEAAEGEEGDEGETTDGAEGTDAGEAAGGEPAADNG